MPQTKPVIAIVNVVASATIDQKLDLVDITKNGRTDSARVSAANAILDRGYGKPPVKDSLEPRTIPPMIIELVACHTNKSEKADD